MREILKDSKLNSREDHKVCLKEEEGTASKGEERARESLSGQTD